MKFISWMLYDWYNQSINQLTNVSFSKQPLGIFQSRKASRATGKFVHHVTEITVRQQKQCTHSWVKQYVNQSFSLFVLCCSPLIFEHRTSLTRSNVSFLWDRKAFKAQSFVQLLKLENRLIKGLKPFQSCPAHIFETTHSTSMLLYENSEDRIWLK